MLEVRRVSMNFSGLQVLNSITFFVKEKEFVGLIGPNGAGKTTLFNCICGVYKPTSGEIRYMGKKIDGKKPHEICRLKVSRTFQLTRTFPEFTTLENVLTGIIAREEKAKSKNINDFRDEALQYLTIVGLESKKDVLAKNLTLAERRMTELARALATRPRLLLLDEVLAGLNPTEISQAVSTLEKIHNEYSISIIWIEHVMHALMGAVERVLVLASGSLIADGTPEEVSRDENVITAYLGS